jgi:riboflavin kinase / FMN hydrolase
MSVHCRWTDVSVLPGAARLLRHLARCKVPLAVATSTPRKSFDTKMSGHGELRDLFSVVICGDEIACGKPAPDIYLEAARQLGVSSCDTLAIEDSPTGIEAALAAGMQVVAVPSLIDRTVYDAHSCQSRCVMLKSLLDFDPVTQMGVRPFTDDVGGTIPLEHWWRLKGPVVTGFGRGSKVCCISIFHPYLATSEAVCNCIAWSEF